MVMMLAQHISSGRKPTPGLRGFHQWQAEKQRLYRPAYIISDHKIWEHTLVGCVFVCRFNCQPAWSRQPNLPVDVTCELNTAVTWNRRHLCTRHSIDLKQKFLTVTLEAFSWLRSWVAVKLREKFSGTCPRKTLMFISETNSNIYSTSFIHRLKINITFQY